MYSAGMSFMRMCEEFSKVLPCPIFSLILAFPPTSDIRGAGGFSKPSILLSPVFESSASTTNTCQPFFKACLANSVHTVLFPQPPLPQTEIFIFQSPLLLPASTTSAHTHSFAHAPASAHTHTPASAKAPRAKMVLHRRRVSRLQPAGFE